MGQQHSSRVGRRRNTLVVAVAVVGVFLTGIGSFSAPVAADVEPSTARCFEVDGSRRDAAIVNLTPVAASGRGNGQLISSDVKANPPVASNVNFGPGSVDPNVAVTSIGADGQVCFQNSQHASVDLVADHLGTIDASAYTPATTAGAPDRKVDTRTGVGGSRIAPSGQLCFAVDGDRGDAAIVNLTPVAASGRGNGQLISSDVKANPPVASNVNFGPGSVDPNVAVTSIGADGQVCFQNSQHASVDLVADHLGTIDASAYTPATTAGAPDRKVDTRTGVGGSRIAPSGQLCFAVDGDRGDAAIVNLTPVAASGRGNGQLISSDVKANPPVASNVNFGPGSVDPNVAVSPVGADGQVCFQNSQHASVDLIADHLGTIDASDYTPATSSGAPDRRVDTRTDVENARPECIDATTTNYDTPTARTMFGLASRAYEIDPGAASERRLDLFGDDVDFEDQMSCWVLVDAIRGAHGSALTDTELIVARNTSTHDLAVAFRGTEADFWDILNDLDAIPRESWTLPNGDRVDDAVHPGFDAAYRAARAQLLAALTDAQRADAPDARVYFTGHSLGGALATLASIDLVDDLMEFGYSRDEVVTYTFGAPRSLSTTMAGHHATYVPNSFAVANPMDPVTHVPPATGLDYAHIPNMTLLHAKLFDSQDRVRIDRGDGRNYSGCLATTPTGVADAAARFLTYHARPQYLRRLATTSFVGKPTVSITISGVVNAPGTKNAGGHNQLRWDTEVEGPCDWVGLWKTSGTLTSTAAPITTRSVVLDTNDVHTTIEGKGDDYWVGYVNMFDELVATKEYFPRTPSVSLHRYEVSFPFKDDIEFDWGVTDPGANDLIVLFDRDPRVAGPNGWYNSSVGRVEAEAHTNPPERTFINVGDDPNKWWVAYIMVDDDGRQRILATSRGVRG